MDNLKTKPLTQQKKFEIANRDKFECQFCGSSPGNDCLEIDHIIPVSIGGTNANINLATACKKCNQGKAARIVVPYKQLQKKERDTDGFLVWFRQGGWSVRVDEYRAVVQHDNTYWIDFGRVHDKTWEGHLLEKRWCQGETWGDFVDMLALARQLCTQKNKLWCS